MTSDSTAIRSAEWRSSTSRVARSSGAPPEGAPAAREGPGRGVGNRRAGRPGGRPPPPAAAVTCCAPSSAAALEGPPPLPPTWRGKRRLRHAVQLRQQARVAGQLLARRRVERVAHLARRLHRCGQLAHVPAGAAAGRDGGAQQRRGS
jgi:hypothetical protein